MKKISALSVVIPAYNEEEVIADTLRALAQQLTPRFDNLELIVIDDGSRDATSQVVEAIPELQRHIRLIRHPENRGYGGALRTGFYSAKNEWILLFPADAQFEVSEIDLLLNEATKVNRKEPFVIWPFRIRRAEGFIRRFNAKGWRWLIGKALGVAVRDIDCGMKLYSRQVFYKIPSLTSEAALIDAEILWHCRHLKIMIREIGVTHLSRQAGTPTGANLKVIMRTLKELKSFRRRLETPAEQKSV